MHGVVARGLAPLELAFFRPGRTENRFPGSEMARYGQLIKEALRKTPGWEGVPSLEEIAGLLGSQEEACPRHSPGTAAHQGAALSHAAAQEVSGSHGLYLPG